MGGVSLRVLLRRRRQLMEYFVSESGAMKPRKQTGLCAKCQRKLSKTVKQGRQMAMIPYIQEWETVDTTSRFDDYLAPGGRADRHRLKAMGALVSSAPSTLPPAASSSSSPTE